jgi:hypothetical protein
MIVSAMAVFKFVGGGMGLLILCLCFPLLGRVGEFLLFSGNSKKEREENIQAETRQRKEEARRGRARDSNLVRSQSSRCKVVKSAVVRTTSSLDSPICGQLDRGTVFSVLEATQLERTVRVRLEHGEIAGWVSTVARSGDRLLEIADDELTPPMAVSIEEMEMEME